MFKLTLSVSKTQPKTKTEGMAITDFVKKEFDVVPETDLKELFTTRLYSTNYWAGGKCGKRNYLGMYGMTMDIDNGLTIDQAKEMFKEFNYIIHTSTSHRADISEKGGTQDRFRIILPADPAAYDKYADVKMAQALYALIIKKYPFVDTQCAEPARKYFPFLNSQYPQLFELHINETGRYYAVSDDEVNAQAALMAAAKQTRKPALRQGMNMVGPDEKYITWDTEVVLTDKTTKVKIRDITEHTTCYCVFCDDINSVSASAHVTFNNEGFPVLVCSHCSEKGLGNNGRYYLPLNEKFHNLFYLENMMYWVKQHGKSINIGRTPEAYLNNLSNDDQKRLKHWLAKNRAYTGEDFKVQRMVDGYGEEIKWSFIDDGVLEVRTPPIAVKVKDNDYINKWLDQVFGQYSEFFKDYLALYCYRNYEPMPVIILTGPRGSGKTTVAEFMSTFFHACHAEWSGNEDHFTGYLEKHLLIVDEANVDKKEQYTKIKALTGRADLAVNKKHKSPYQIVNNICIIMLTNEQVPMYLVSTEKPASPSDNQFFMYYMDRVNTVVNSRIKEELRDRAGWYIRTELRARYEDWKARDIGRTCRYGLPVPITPLLNDQYENARTSLDYECDKLFLACLNGIQVKDRLGNLIEMVGPFDVVSSDDIQSLINATKVTNSNPKSFRERMQAHGYLKKTKTRKNGLDAWEVVKTATVGKLIQTKGT